MATKKLTAQERVLKYMQDFGTITTWNAFADLGITRLSEYIRRIRIDYDVKDTWENATNRYGEKVRYKKYYLGEKY